ncbi:hypothetical protein PC123_g16908 [Phytophthora cactorum]|nr:hypothetical protein PC123_g16908 [Phytophthora cactorum]
MHATGNQDSNIARYLRLKGNGAVADDSQSKIVHELRIVKPKATMNTTATEHAAVFLLLLLAPRPPPPRSHYAAVDLVLLVV